MLDLGSVFIRFKGDADNYLGTSRRVRSDLDNTNRKAASVAGSFGKMFGALAAIGAGTAVVGFFKSAVMAASDFEESLSKATVVFGPAVKQIEAFSETAAVNLQMSSQKALEATATYGNLLVTLGQTPDVAARMSMDLVQLAADLASFNNVGTEETLLAIRSALTGESEPMKKFGADLSEATLKAKALELGLWNGKGTLDMTTKSQAAYAAILEQTATAQGDIARTGGGLAGQLKTLSAQWDDLKVAAGLALLEPVTNLVNWLNTHMGELELLMGGMGNAAVAGANVVTQTGQGLGYVASIIGGSARTIDEGTAIEMQLQYFQWGQDIGNALAEGLRSGEDPQETIEQLLGSLDPDTNTKLISDGMYDWQTLESNAETMARRIAESFLGTTEDHFTANERMFQSKLLELFEAEPGSEAHRTILEWLGIAQRLLDESELVVRVSPYSPTTGRRPGKGKIDYGTDYGPTTKPKRSLGGPVPGRSGEPVDILAHGGEYVLNETDTTSLARGIDAVRAELVNVRREIAGQRESYNRLTKSGYFARR